MTDLLAAVDALTLPAHTMVVQWVDGHSHLCPTGCGRDGEHAHTTRVEHEPLLLQLEAAIASTIGVGGRGGSSWDRNVLDSDALYQFSLIESQIRDWCRLAGVEASRHPVDNLRAWYVSRLARPGEHEAADVACADILWKWAATIRAKMNPARTMELTAACPVCGADTWTDTDGVVYRHPIRIQYRDQDPDILAHANAICRACDQVWKGAAELRALRWDVDEHEATTQNRSENNA